MGFREHSPDEVRLEIKRTDRRVGEINTAVERSPASHNFKALWRGFFSDWEQFRDMHEAYIERLRDQVFDQAQKWRTDAEAYYRALQKNGWAPAPGGAAPSPSPAPRQKSPAADGDDSPLIPWWLKWGGIALGVWYVADKLSDVKAVRHGALSAGPGQPVVVVMGGE